MYILFILVSFGASIIGSICGIGGGVIIKPVLDASGVMNVAEISFLSGCTVLAMALFSVSIAWVKKESKVDFRISILLSLGAAAGGIIGRQMFSEVWYEFADKNTPGLIQAICLIVLTAATFVYMLKKKDIHTHKLSNAFGTVVIGLILGLLSSFLGIGGGPINLVVLFYFFSMETKAAAENSLFIVLFSQVSSLVTTVVTNTIPAVDVLPLIIIIVGGISGGFIGKVINKRINGQTVETLFMFLMAAIVVVNIYNIFKFSV